jgi:hypothetical protein
MTSAALLAIGLVRLQEEFREFTEHLHTRWFASRGKEREKGELGAAYNS